MSLIQVVVGSALGVAASLCVSVVKSGSKREEKYNETKEEDNG